MQSINFEVGNYKEYPINEDKNNTIRINLSDINFYYRFKDAYREIEKYFDEIAKIENPDDEIFREIDKKVRELINSVFGCDVCTQAFGNINCMADTSTGLPVIINFLNAFAETVIPDFKSALEKEQKTLEEKTAKYIEPVVNSAPKIDVSILSEEQKKALIEELSKW